MIDPVNNTQSLSFTAPAKPAEATANPFDAALKAAQKAAASEEAHKKEIEAIKQHGFTDWVRDTQIEKLKEELRKKVLAAMGLDEDQLGRMSAAVQQVLEQKIQEEVERQLEEIAAQEQGKGQSVVANAAKPVGNNDPQGKKCPVIPGLAWPGGASVL
ncbi:MAG TPA: hypothetical protein VLL76_06170 [Candidatus Omnitrophota bacterium]|nr:hypothetical protein [Candidatus Omnitrophota bacterium]